MSNAINAVSKRLNPNDYYHAPTFYHPRFCEMLVAHMAAGRSFETFAMIIQIGRSTLYAWAQRYADFADAYDRGRPCYMAYWEDVAKDGFKGIPPSVWRWNMARVKTMYKDDMEEQMKLQVEKARLIAEAKRTNATEPTTTPEVPTKDMMDSIPIYEPIAEVEEVREAITVSEPIATSKEEIAITHQVEEVVIAPTSSKPVVKTDKDIVAMFRKKKDRGHRRRHSK